MFLGAAGRGWLSHRRDQRQHLRRDPLALFLVGVAAEDELCGAQRG